jgi:hypothetical protein
MNPSTAADDPIRPPASGELGFRKSIHQLRPKFLLWANPLTETPPDFTVWDAPPRGRQMQNRSTIGVF